MAYTSKLLRGKHTQTTVYNSCVHTFRKSNAEQQVARSLQNSSWNPFQVYYWGQRSPSEYYNDCFC